MEKPLGSAVLRLVTETDPGNSEFAGEISKAIKPEHFGFFEAEC